MRLDSIEIDIFILSVSPSLKLCRFRCLQFRCGVWLTPFSPRLARGSAGINHTDGSAALPDGPAPYLVCVIYGFFNRFLEALESAVSTATQTAFPRYVITPRPVTVINHQNFTALASNDFALMIAMFSQTIVNFLLEQTAQLALGCVKAWCIQRRFKLRIRAISKPCLVIVLDVDWDI